MSTHAKRLSLFLFLLIGIMSFISHPTYAANGVTLYTPYTKFLFHPESAIDYTIDVINGST